LHDCDVDGFEPEQDESDTLWPSERLHVTERVWVPPPQDAEQDPHEPVVYEYVPYSLQSKGWQFSSHCHVELSYWRYNPSGLGFIHEIPSCLAAS